MKNIELDQDENLAVDSLVEKLEVIIEKMPPEQVTLIEILDIIGADSLMLLTIFLSLIFLIPVSIPGVSTVFGSAILLIGVSLLFSRKLFLPKRIANRPLSSKKLIEGMQRALVWLRRLEKISRPHRMPRLAAEGKVGILNQLSYILAALLLMMPFGFVPFSNTLPAIALIFLAIGLIQKDGLSILLGHLSNLATIIYFALLVTGGGMTLYELFLRMGGG
ncbi:MAG: exopolysaccharide biosynthesis protein [Anaerolineales bacterium]|nr:exopolysaccharide biosynthesis protein [Anaerolineales bacterium]